MTISETVPAANVRESAMVPTGAAWRPLCVRGAIALLLGLATPLVTSRVAFAAEGEPAALAGVGVERWYTGEADTAPMAELGGTYGVGEWVDARMLVGASRLNLCGADSAASACGDQTWALSMTALLAFKLDVIQWVPYAAPLVSYHWLTGGPIPTNGHAHDLGVGAAMGIDYVPAREYSVGIQAGCQGFVTALADGAFDRGILTAGLHLEYRWGW